MKEVSTFVQRHGLKAVGLVFVAIVMILLFRGTEAAEDKSNPPLTPPLTAGAPPWLEGDPYEMNGIRLKDYQDFQKKWKLVTVRYRTDTGEQRFTYANDIAFEALMKGVKDYPDGAVFAKIGIMTKDDPEFTSSKVPSGAQRIQFMLRNKAKYAHTGGWGYAVFAPMGYRLDPSPPKKQAEACDACHQVVKKSRGEVFSQPASLVSIPAAPPPPPPDQATPPPPAFLLNSPQMHFSNWPVGKLPERLRKLLPPKTSSVWFLEGTIRDHIFSGTLNEIRPILMKEAGASASPALLLDEDNQQFTLVFSAESSGTAKPCPSGQTNFKVYMSGFYSENGSPPALKTKEESVCALP
jgi:cytochrome P460